MYVLYGHADLMLPQSSSLKEKRRTILSILARIRRRFNISITEVSYQDRWQRSQLGFTAVCNKYDEAEFLVTVIRDIIDEHEDTCDTLDLVYEINNYKVLIPD